MVVRGHRFCGEAVDRRYRVGVAHSQMGCPLAEHVRRCVELGRCASFRATNMGGSVDVAFQEGDRLPAEVR
eukprot:2999364-Alexandrium_andersonii.AAC.1